MLIINLFNVIGYFFSQFIILIKVFLFLFHNFLNLQYYVINAFPFKFLKMKFIYSKSLFLIIMIIYFNFILHFLIFKCLIFILIINFQFSYFLKIQSQMKEFKVISFKNFNNQHYYL